MERNCSSCSISGLLKFYLCTRSSESWAQFGHDSSLAYNSDSYGPLYYGDSSSKRRQICARRSLCSARRRNDTYPNAGYNCMLREHIITVLAQEKMQSLGGWWHKGREGGVGKNEFNLENSSQLFPLSRFQFWTGEWRAKK